MLTQDVKVKANGCVWGVKNPGTDWMKVMTGAMIGATLGGMIGQGFQTTHPAQAAKEPKKTATEPGSPNAATGPTPPSTTPTAQALADAELRTNLTNSSTGALTGPNSTSDFYNDNGVAIQSTQGNFTVNGRDYTITQNTQIGDQAGTSAFSQYTLFDSSTGQSFTGNSINDVSNSMVRYQNTTGAWISSTWVGQIVNAINPFTDNTWSAPEAGEWRATNAQELAENLPEQKVKNASFTIWQGHQQGWFAVMGAVIGGILAYMDQDFDCSDSQFDQIVGYTDFVINLEGGTVSVPSMDGNGNEEKEIPSDAGALNFSLEGVSPDWDFTDAYYSGTETVAIRFTNTGLDDQTPRYGTLVVNATKNIHGYDPMAITAGTSSGSSTEFDVLCTKKTFGNYWIGSDEESGLCSGVTQSNYSQKYHMRVISSDPKGEDAYIRKYSSCYMGSLTGSTGEEALPRIKLNWDWDAIGVDACDYTNPDYIYCDASQFMISLTKKLANLDEFLMQNGSFSCPASPMQEEVNNSINQINSQINTIPEGFIGINDIEISLDEDVATAVLKINNKSGAAQTTYISYSWKGEEEPVTGMQEYSAPIGISELTLDSVDIEKYEGIYYFMAVVNGEKGDRIAVSRAFTNMDEENNSCWIEQSTTRIGGIPSLIYYVDGKESVSYTNAITNTTDLYNTINFAAYLTKDGFSEDFFNDFKEFYRQQFLQKVNANATESKIVDYLTSGNFKVTKKFSGESEIEPGLYEVYININAPEMFRVVDDNTTQIEVELLLVKSPSVDSPFYRMPFDGMLGEKNNGRQGYGSAYKNIDVDFGGIQVTSTGFSVNTFDSAMSNGITTIETKTKTNFEEVNVAPGTRGQIASASISNNNATLKLAPTFVTPVIGRVTVNSNEGKMAYNLNNEKKAIVTGGNLAYWTGAAKTKNFYGGNAIDSYQDSPDYRLTKLGDNVYGYEFNDISREGTMMLKTLFFIPAESSSYILQAQDNSTSFWTANSEFAPTVQLGGINGMRYNDQSGNSKINSLHTLFEAVREGKVCVSSDGASTSFWWNPAVIETVGGATTSMSAKELSLIGTN